MVAHHAAHRESRDIDTLLVDAVLVVHLVDNGLDKIEILVARNIPRFIFAIGEYNHKTARVCNALPFCSIFLVGGILIITMHLDNQGAILLYTGRSIH